MNAIIYTRVSTAEQAEGGYSLKSQEELCIDYAKRNNYDVLKVFIEKGESAKTANRTELKNMLEYSRINKNKIDALIIYKIDRLSRDTIDALTIMSKLKGYGIVLKSVTEPIDNSAVGSFLARFFSSNSELDNDIRSERARLGMRQAVLSGRWLWNAPLGYIFKYENLKSYLIPSDKADIIRKIFKEFVSGKKQFEICNELKLSGIKISKQHLNEILKNYLYIGKIKTKSTDYKPVDGIHKPIIDDITFYKAQEILNPKSEHTYNIKYQNEFPLKRFLKCPYCNRNLAGSYSTGRHKKKYPYYHCVTKGCLYKPIRADYAEYLFVGYLKSFEMQEDVIEKIFSNAKSYLEGNQQENKNIISNLKRDITIFEEKKTKIEDLAIDGFFDKDTYLKKISEVNSQIIAKKLQLSDYKNGIVDIDQLVDYGKRFVCNLSSFWLNLEMGRKRVLQEILFPEGLQLENNQFRTAKISPILRLIQEQNDLKNDGVSIMAGHRGFEPELIC
jgi:DNA invertase Pin-like site-specific DNA recombinase